MASEGGERPRKGPSWVLYAVTVIAVAVALFFAGFWIGRLGTEPIAPSSNHPPVAVFAYSPTSALPGDNVTFNASFSFDSDGRIVAYGWTFGDGGTGTGTPVIHAYARNGTFRVTLTVTDDGGLASNRTLSVEVRPLPKMRVGTNTPFPPFEFYDSSNRLVGFDIDLANEIGRRLRRTVVWQDFIDFSALLSAIQSSTLDMGAAAIVSSGPVGAQRNASMYFSFPYFVVNLGVLVTSSSTFRCPSANCTEDQFANLNVGVVAGTDAEFWARNNLVSRGATVHAYADVSSAILALKSGATNVTLLERLLATRIDANDPGIVSAGTVRLGILYSFAFPKTVDGSALRDLVNGALGSVVADGTYVALLVKWF